MTLGTRIGCLLAIAGASAGMEGGSGWMRAAHARDIDHHHADADANQEKHDHGLPNLDARFDAAGEPLGLVRAALAKHTDAVQRDKAVARLAAQVPNLTVDADPVLGTPSFVRSWSTMLTDARPGVDPLALVREYVMQNADLFTLDAADLADVRVTRDYPTDHNGVRHLTLQQQVKGVDLFDCGIKANVSRDGRLINIASTMIPSGAGLNIAPAKLSDVDALKAAAKNAGMTLSKDPTPAEDPQGASLKRRWNAGSDFRSDRKITTELVYFPLTRDDIRPAYWVVVPVPGTPHTYRMVVDATDGSVLHRMNETNFDQASGSSTFRVFTGRSPTPGPSLPSATGFVFPFESRKLVNVPGAIPPASPFGWFDTNGAVGAEFTDTRGNAVDAHLDRDANNVADTPRPSGGTGLVFDPVQDHTAGPLGWADASVVQGFYYANIFHNRLYDLGFTEAAGNFQTNNYGRGGAGNDAVQLDCLDGSGTNNANFGTPADGSPGRCQMYIFTAANPDRDTSMDADVIYHEFAHGLSNRLTGGPANASALNNTQSGGMGEGWSDFVAICLSTVSGDNFEASVPAGAYSTVNFFRGIRRFPYSTNMSINPLTWDAYGASGTTTYGVTRSTQVHNTGEIWCQSLLDARANLYKTQGFAANQLILQLVVDGMKLQPANPSFIQARDAVLQADLAANGGVNQPQIWRAFARRGLGVSAATTGSTATTVTVAFDAPAFAESADAGDLPASATLVNGAGNVTAISGTLGVGDVDMYRINICSPTSFSATTIAGATINTQLFLFDLNGRGVAFSDDAGATTQSTISNAFVTLAGEYYLAVSGSNVDPRAGASTIWADTPTTTERAPDGVTPTGILSSWTGTDSTGGGTYTIKLTGACASTSGQVATAPEPLTAFGSPIPNVVSVAGSAVVRFIAYVDPATQPASTGVGVSLNGSAIGVGTLTLLDTGVNGDTTAGDGVYTAQANVASLPVGNYVLPYTVTDAQARAFNGTMLYTVNDPVTTCCIPGGTCVVQPTSACLSQLGTIVGNVACEIRPCTSRTETEPNGTIATATDASRSFIAVTSDRYHMGWSGGIAASTDIDYATVGPMQVGDIITVSQSGAPGLRGTNTDPLARLYRSGTTTVVTSNDDSGPGFDSLIYRFSIATADTYLVAGYRATTTSTGTYQMGVMLENIGTPPSTGSSYTSETEPNDTAATANAATNAWRRVQYISSIKGNITAADEDFYAYDFDAGDLVSIVVDSASALTPEIELQSSTGTVLAADDGTGVATTGAGETPIYAFNIPSTGRYYLRTLATSATGTGEYYAVIYLSALTAPPICPADFNNSGTVSVQDIFDFLAAWFNSDPRADINGAGGVSVQDIFDFLAVWFAGC